MRFLLCCFAAACGLGFAQESASPIQAGNASYQRGNYEEARQSFLRAWDLAQQTAPTDPLRYDILKRLASVRGAAGEFADADYYLQMAINWRENTNGLNDPKIADDLLLSFSLARGMKQFERALLIVQRVAALHRAAFGEDSTPLADDFSRMAIVYLDQKNLPSAINMLNVGLQIRTKVSGAMDPSLVPDLDRLAGSYIASRIYDKAEETYRHALVIRETLYGKEDADLIATVDGLAYAVFGQKKFDVAEPIYQRLIALWVKSVGEDHPMVAVALDKVAVFYSEQKKYDQCKELTDRSIAIRSHFLASGLSGAATQQMAEGRNADAMALYQRALAVLDPPHPIFEELRGEIEGFVKELQPHVPKKTAPPVKKK